MNILNPCLQRLVAAETLDQALCLMRPHELAVAILRADGLTDVQIADLLGLTPTAVNNRMTRARARILDAMPELEVFLADRRSPNSPSQAHLTGRRAVLTPGSLAAQWGVTPSTVRRWCAEGRFPRASRTESGRWRIPAESLIDFQRPAPRGGDHRSAEYRQVREATVATP